MSISQNSKNQEIIILQTPIKSEPKMKPSNPENDLIERKKKTEDLKKKDKEEFIKSLKTKLEMLTLFESEFKEFILGNAVYVYHNHETEDLPEILFRVL